jgi:DNA-binding response OmpR family regulator
MVKILLLEDDELFATSLIDFLELEDFEVDLAIDGEDFFEKNYIKNHDIYILDINVPKIKGTKVLQMLKDINDHTPTIFLTSYKDKDILKECFSIGADDFLTKPVDTEELILRIFAILKRSGKSFENIIIDDIIFNPQKKEIIKNNKPLKLPTKVIDLFELFCENRGKTVTKDQIISRLWSKDEDYSDGSLRVYINKIKSIVKPQKIINIKGIGYKIEF